MLRGMLAVMILWAGFAVGYAAEKTGTRRETTPIGLTAKLTELIAVLDDSPGAADRLQIVLIGGLDGKKESTAAVVRQQQWFAESTGDKLRQRVLLHAIPNARPDGGITSRFPPKDGFYDAATDREARYLWRWLAMQAPDLVIDVRAEQPDNAADSLVKQLAAGVAETGGIPAVSVVAGADKDQPFDLAAIIDEQAVGKSSAAKELARRQQRTAQEVAAELLKTYGRDLPQVAYIPALAVAGRQRYGTLLGDAEQTNGVAKIVVPYLKREQNPVPKSGSDAAGHLLFAELAEQAPEEDRKRWIDLVCAAADQVFKDDGRPRTPAPFHNEMSDAVFMSGPILAAAGRLTSQPKYRDACLAHLRAMHKLCLRSDGLYRHSPQDEAAWGRGNGFPALGMSMIISQWPQDDESRGELIAWQLTHLRALLKHQDRSGCWHQVIDRPASYREFTCTAMISYALWTGMREGYLPRDEFESAAKKGWEAVKLRIGPQGRLVDVCVGTGKQKTLRDYYERPASLGVDPRGGAMGLMLATEVMKQEVQTSKK